MLQAWCFRRPHAVAAAISFAILAHLAGVPCVAADNGRRAIGVTFDVCQVTEPFRPSPFNVSPLPIPGGDLLLVPWLSDGWAVLRLSADGRTLRTIEADFPPGRLTGAVRLPDDRVLISAEEGIYRFDGRRKLERIADCNQTGPAEILMQGDRSALTLSDGSVLLAGEGGLLSLSPGGRLERFGSPATPRPERVWMLAGDAVLVEDSFGLYLVPRAGSPTPVATGALGSNAVVVRRKDQQGGAATTAFPRTGSERLPRAGVALLDANGRATWAKPPPDVRALSQAIELDDGRVFLLSDRGLLRLHGDDTLRNVSPTVRLVCANGRDDREISVRALRDGPTLVRAPGRLFFTIDRNDRVVAVLGPIGCLSGSSPFLPDVGVAADGSIYHHYGNVLYRAAPGSGTTAVAPTVQTGQLGALTRSRTDLLLWAEGGVFRVRADGGLERLAPAGSTLPFPIAEPPVDSEERPLICVNRNALHRLDSQGILQPLRAAEGIDCLRGIERVGTLGLLMKRDKASHVIVTHDDRAIPIPYARVWKVTQLADGAAILMAMHAERDDGAASLSPAEEAAVPRAFIRVSPEGRVDPVAFEGPGIDPNRPRDPTWGEQRGIRAAHFSSPTRGWAILGGRGLLSITDDGGTQWRGVIADGLPIAGLASLSFTADGRQGIAMGKEAAWLTDDAGATWRRAPTPAGTSDIQRVWLLGPDGLRAYALAKVEVKRAGERDFTTELWESSDGGRTWAARALPLPAVAASAPSTGGFDLTGQRGWFVAADRVFTTGDGGNTWQLFGDLRDVGALDAARWRKGYPWPLSAIAYWTPGEHGCIASAQFFCIVPSDAPDRYALPYIHTDDDVFILALALAPDGKRGWAVGTQGTILATEDGGAKWSAQPSGTRATFEGVFFLPDGLHGWAWGKEGFLPTRDGGKSWKPARGS